MDSKASLRKPGDGRKWRYPIDAARAIDYLREDRPDWEELISAGKLGIGLANLAADLLSYEDWFKRVPMRMDLPKILGAPGAPLSTIYLGLLQPLDEEARRLSAALANANHVGINLGSAASVLTYFLPRKVAANPEAMMELAIEFAPFISGINLDPIGGPIFPRAESLTQRILEVIRANPNERRAKPSEGALLSVALQLRPSIPDEPGLIQAVDRWRKRKTPRSLGNLVLVRAMEIALPVISANLELVEICDGIEGVIQEKKKTIGRHPRKPTKREAASISKLQTYLAGRFIREPEALARFLAMKPARRRTEGQ